MYTKTMGDNSTINNASVNITSTKIFKCCNEHNQTSALCPGYNNDEEFSKSLSSLKVKDNPSAVLTWTYAVECCQRFEVEQPWDLFSDGSLFTEGEYIPSNDFCLELNVSGIIPYACFEKDDSVIENSDVQNIVYPIGFFISVPFFIANLLVYSLLPELRRKPHGKAFIFFQASMIVAYSITGYFDLDRDISDTPCLILAYVMQFAFLATFFWMNVMCFDIWWTFSSLKKPGGSVRERDLKKFLLYSAYAWGFPLIILVITLIMDYTPILSSNDKLKPQMGENKCFFKTAAATWLYLYGPIAILIVANLIMFAFTAKKIFLHTRETQVLKSEDSKRHDSKDRERFNLYLKLFVVMGVNWVAELVSWAFESKSNFWYITDITNTLQGLIIFIIFVCKPRVLRLLEASLCPGRAARRSTMNSSSRSRNTTTSMINGSSRHAQVQETVQLKSAVHDSDSNM